MLLAYSIPVIAGISPSPSYSSKRKEEGAAIEKRKISSQECERRLFLRQGALPLENLEYVRTDFPNTGAAKGSETLLGGLINRNRRIMPNRVFGRFIIYRISCFRISWNRLFKKGLHSGWITDWMSEGKVSVWNKDKRLFA